MGKATKGGFYAVQKGRQPGIYNTWAECEAATKGFAGAVYKKLPTRDAAQQFVKGNGYGAASSSSASSSTSSAAGSSSAAKYKPYSKGQSKYSNSSSTLGKRKSPPSSHVLSSKRSHPNPIFTSTRKTMVYCDGSSIGNGKTSARAGWGVFFPDPALHHLNESRRLPGSVQTNNRAELTAIIRAIELCPDDGRQLVILSDSKYSMNCVGNWIAKWKKNGWRTALGKDVENKDLIVSLDDLMERRSPRPVLEYVKAHAGIDGNEVVDRMAKYGASLPEVSPEEDEKSVSGKGEGKEEKTAGAASKTVDFEGFTIDVRFSPAKREATQ